MLLPLLGCMLKLQLASNVDKLGRCLVWINSMISFFTENPLNHYIVVQYGHDNKNGWQRKSIWRKHSKCAVNCVFCNVVFVDGGGVLTTGNYEWPRRLCHVALRSSLEWLATECVSLIYRDTLVAPRCLFCSNEVDCYQQHLSSEVKRAHAPPPFSTHTSAIWASFTSTNTHRASEIFQNPASFEQSNH